MSLPNPVNTGNSYDNFSNAVDVNDNANVNAKSNDKQRNPRPEPIHLKLLSNWRQINGEVDKLTDNKVYKKYLPKTIEEFRAIQQFFSEKNYEIFGLKLKNELALKVLLKGIPTDVKIEEIKEELLSLNFQVPRVA